MARDLNAELSDVKRELRNAVRELYDIASGVERSFKGIGNDKCAKNIRNIAYHYESEVLPRLNRMHFNKASTDDTHGGGGRSH